MFKNEELILDGIRRGAYNLYLGAGATHECKNSKGNKLPLGEELFEIIKNYFNKNANNLYQITQIVPPEELDTLFRELFSVNKVSQAIAQLPSFVWKRIFTLNIDNAIEFAYEISKDRKQSLETLNFKDNFYIESDISKLQIIHLHGLIKQPDDGYVFNANQYIQNIKDNNTWLAVFSDLFSTDAFIMSGLSLNEPDVDFYLSYRSHISQKPSALSPSILVEPYPNDYTKSVCEKHGLQLVQKTFEDFISYVSSKIGSVPTVYDLKNPKKAIMENIDIKNKFYFFSDFELIENTNDKTSDKTPFDYGFEPSILDIQSDKDIHRNITNKILNKIISIKKRKYGNLILLTGKYLNGKTTIALRVLNHFSKQDYYIFRLKSLRGFDVDNTIKCIENLDKPCIFYIDNLAEFINLAYELIVKNKSVIVIGTERDYRITHIKKVLKDQFFEYNCDQVTENEKELLLKKYHSLGLILNNKILANTKILLNSTIGEQVCIILNHYNPIKNKIEDLLKVDALPQKDIQVLLAVYI